MAITKIPYFLPGRSPQPSIFPSAGEKRYIKCCTVFSQQKRVTLKMQRTLWKVFSPKFCNRVLLRVLRIYKNARILIDSGVFHWWSLGDSNPNQYLFHECGSSKNLDGKGAPSKFAKPHFPVPNKKVGYFVGYGHTKYPCRIARNSAQNRYPVLAAEPPLCSFPEYCLSIL